LTAETHRRTTRESTPLVEHGHIAQMPRLSGKRCGAPEGVLSM
jgi:hypothetical protein